MKFLDYFKYAIDNILKHKLRSILVVISSIIAMLLMSLAIFLYELDNYNIRECDRTLQNGIDNTGYFMIEFDDSSENDDLNKKLYEMKKLLNEVTKIPEVENVGSFTLMGITSEGFNDLIKRQKGHRISEPTKEMEMTIGNMESFEAFSLESDLFNMFKLKLQKGELPSKLNYVDNCKYVYLGYHYRDIPIGTVIERKVKNQSYKYIVAGILKKGSKILNDNMYNLSITVDKYCWNLDYEAIVLDNVNTGMQKYFSVKEGSDMNKVRDRINRISKKLGQTVITGDLKEVINIRHTETKNIIKYILQLLIITLIVVIITQACMLIIVTINDINKYAIMNAFGVSKKEINLIIIIENLIKFIFAICVSWLGCIWYINYNYSSSKKVFLYVIEVFYRAVSWKIIIVFFIIFLLASLVPIIELQRRSLVSIIGGRKI